MKPLTSPPPADAPAPLLRNPARDYWRSCILHEVCGALGHTASTFEPILMANKDTIGASMQQLLNELCDQEMRDGRTHGMHLGCRRRSERIARTYPQFRTAHAPQWATQAQAEPELELEVAFDSDDLADGDYPDLVDGSFKVVLEGEVAAGFEALNATADFETVFTFTAFE